MSVHRSRLLAQSAAATALAGSALLVGQVVWAATRPFPSFADHDPSGVVGAPDGIPLRVAVLGDSSCTGPGLEDPSDIWVRQLARRIGDRFRVEIRSLAAGGSKAHDLVQVQLGPAVALAPDIALVSVGGNDALRAVPLRAFRRDLTTIVDHLRPVSGLVALSGVGDLSTIPRLNQPLAAIAGARGRALNRIHRDVARTRGAVAVDQWRWATREFQTRPELFAPDAFHASAAGHAIWAAVAHDAIRPHLRGIAGAAD